ncbi:hopanoid-associated phosphorylase [Roseiarcus fermentans]|uniref:Hopanoid-associated phosphorylase n=1 Tax=Roseiarcus fermentans TaxID=1473586 RepID=A0A366FEP6_9HYPH|nr:phosphorylase [Roseiarcus fermentans]RBP12195.1 hopanoid-associated phosphorylase [Roseiarcus fermentans]
MAAPRSQISSVLIVCGLKREAALAAGPGAIVAFGNGATLQARFAALADTPLRMVVSFGLCGGLDPSLRSGDVLLGSEVVARSESVATDEALTLALERRLAEAGVPATRGKFAAADAPVLTAGEKRALRETTGAAAVDMESLAAGRFARARGAPFAILRAVSDPADRDLPPLVLAALDADGEVDVGAVVRGLARSPAALPGLIAAAFDSGAAFRMLRRCGRLAVGL